MRDERDAAVVSALSTVALLVVESVMTASFRCCGTFPLRQMRVVSRWSSSRMVRSCYSLNFSSSAGRPSGSTTFAFAIAFIQVDEGREDRSCLAKL